MFHHPFQHSRGKSRGIHTTKIQWSVPDPERTQTGWVHIQEGIYQYGKFQNDTKLL